MRSSAMDVDVGCNSFALSRDELFDLKVGSSCDKLFYQAVLIREDHEQSCIGYLLSATTEIRRMQFNTLYLWP